MQINNEKLNINYNEINLKPETSPKSVKEAQNDLRFLLALTSGDILDASIKDINPNSITLLLNDGHIIDATPLSMLDLKIGDSAKFVVTDNKNGKISLEVLKSDIPEVKQSHIKEALFSAGLVINDKNIKLAESLLDNNLPINPATLKEAEYFVSKDTTSNISSNIENLMFLIKEEFPAELNTLKTFNSFLSNELNLINDAHNLLNEIDNLDIPTLKEELIKIISRSGEIETSGNPKYIESNEVTINNPHDQMLNETPFGNEKIPSDELNNKLVTHNSYDMNENVISEDDISLPNMSMKDSDKINQNIPLKDATINVSKEMPNESIEKDTGASINTEADPDHGKPNKEPLKLPKKENINDLSKDTDFKNPKHKLKDERMISIYKKFFIDLDEDKDIDLNKFFKELYEIVKNIKEKTENIPSARRIFESAEKVSDNLEFANQIRNYKEYMQIPFILNGAENQGELHIFKKDKNEKDLKKNASILLSLDYELLGHVEIFVNKAWKNLSIQFRSDKGATLKLINENSSKLSALFSEKGFMISSINIKHISEKSNIAKTETEDNETPKTLKRYSFDMRV